EDAGTTRQMSSISGFRTHPLDMRVQHMSGRGHDALPTVPTLAERELAREARNSRDSRARI
ncbi:MAG TPA: hypothetical protein VFO20_06860, partial [Propionibacteriaceae bacterium]|nr:hypothetical protein [Propionibacteriaceae bacterium]